MRKSYLIAERSSVRNGCCSTDIRTRMYNMKIVRAAARQGTDPSTKDVAFGERERTFRANGVILGDKRQSVGLPII